MERGKFDVLLIFIEVSIGNEREFIFRIDSKGNNFLYSLCNYNDFRVILLIDVFFKSGVVVNG